jgi:Ca-activated chloride channel homolog
VLVGRYTGESSNVKIELSGEVSGKPQTFSLSANFPAVATDAEFLPRLWASRKIGYLSDEIRDEKDEVRKKELIAQIEGLSQDFGILSAYTAMFVPEPIALPQTPGKPISGAGGSFGGGGAASMRVDLKAAAPARSGEAAVNFSQYGRAGRGQAQSGNAYALDALAGKDLELARAKAGQIQYANSRAFYQRNNRWEDGKFDPKKQAEIVKIKLYSEAYFALTRRNADFGKWAAIGESVLVTVSAKQAILFSDDGKETLTEKELIALAGK